MRFYAVIIPHPWTAVWLVSSKLVHYCESKWKCHETLCDDFIHGSTLCGEYFLQSLHSESFIFMHLPLPRVAYLLGCKQKLFCIPEHAHTINIGWSKLFHRAHFSIVLLSWPFTCTDATVTLFAWDPTWEGVKGGWCWSESEAELCVRRASSKWWSNLTWEWSHRCIADGAIFGEIVNCVFDFRRSTAFVGLGNA